MRVIFFGTPDFAVPVLRALATMHQLAAVVTQPDKPKGRGNKTLPPPVKDAALKLSVPVLQPRRVKTHAFAEELRAYNADVFIVAAYGRMLPPGVLSLPPYGCLNVHASLLPKYRGASPIQQALAESEEVTGVTIMQMDEGIDTGDMLHRRAIPIAPEDTGGSLTVKLAELGAEALIEALELLEAGRLTPQKQDAPLATYAPLLTKEGARVDWSQPSERIVNLIRAMSPTPAAWTTHGGTVFKLYAASVGECAATAAPGSILELSVKNGLTVAAVGGSVRITELQAPGGKRMRAADYLRGHDMDIQTAFE